MVQNIYCWKIRVKDRLNGVDVGKIDNRSTADALAASRIARVKRRGGIGTTTILPPALLRGMTEGAGLWRRATGLARRTETCQTTERAGDDRRDQKQV